MPVRTAAWYSKAQLVSQSTGRLFRHDCLGAALFMASWLFLTSQAEADVVKIPRVVFEGLTDVLCHAA
jgi:hypothetical protein